MKLLDSSGKEITEINFGTVEIGKTQTFTCILENDTQAELVDIDIKFNNDEVKILSKPSSLTPFGKDKVELSWKPTLKERKGLKLEVSVEATEIWKP